MVEGFNLEPARSDLTFDAGNRTAYKKFIRSIQWLAFKTQPDIIETNAKRCQHNIKRIDKCYKAVIYLLR